MLFNAQHFEQFFDEKPLRKALRLFEKGSVRFISKYADAEYEFLIDKTFNLSLKKKGDKILSYACSCKNANLCEHLGAVIFYLQQEALGFSEKKAGRKVPADVDNTKPQKPYRASVKTKYGVYANKVKLILKPHLESKILVQAQLDEISASISELTLELQGTDKSFYLDLALMIQLPSVFNVRVKGDAQQLRLILTAAEEALDGFYRQGLSKLQTDNWRQATFESVKNNTILNSEAFVFFIPRAVSILKDKTDFEQLRTTLNKRKLKKHYLYYFDQLLIAKLQVAIKESQLFNNKSILNIYAEETEFVIARAELEFCANKQSSAFKLLGEKYEVIKKTKPFYFNAYLDYMIRKANDKNKKDLELYYLKESFIHGLSITPVYLERFIDLLPEADRQEKINGIIAEIKNGPGYLFDKIANLLLKTGKTDELLKEIKKQKNKFSLLHKIAMQKLPHHDAGILALYTEHLSEAIAEAGSYVQQRFLVDKAREYINKLPDETAAALVTNLCDKVGSFRQIYRYLKL